MTQRLDYGAAAPGGMKALGGVYGHIGQCGLPSALGWVETVTRVAETAVPEAAFGAARAEFGEKELATLSPASPPQPPAVPG